MISEINWPQITTAMAGVILAAALAAVGYLFRGREERTRIRKVGLFHLLELWRQLRFISLCKVTDLLDVFIAEVNRQVPGLEISEDERKNAGSVLAAVSQPMLSDVMGKREQSLEESFLETIEQLSKVDPLIAFRLSGNRTLKGAIATVTAYFKHVEMLVAAANPQELPKFQAMAGAAEEFISEDAVRELEKDIKSVSRRIGPAIWLQTAYYLRKKRKRNAEDLRKLIRPYIAKLVPLFHASSMTTSAHTGSKQQSP